jgi:hypothetical protein
MTKYSSSNRRRAVPRPDSPHPIWRGIGCLMIVIVPVMAFTLGLLTVQIALALNWPVPIQLTGYPVLPASLFSVNILVPILIFIEHQNNFYALMTLTILYTVVLGALFSLIYAIIYRFVGPPKYGPQDAPPPNIKVRPYKR